LKKLLLALLILLASPIVFAETIGNNYTASGTFVGEVLSNASVKISYSFIARDSAHVSTVGVLTRKFGSDALAYRLTLEVDSGGNPGGAFAFGDFVSTLSGRVWKFALLNQTASLAAGRRYHLVITFLSGLVSGSNFVTSASLGGQEQPDGRWPVDLTPGGLKRLYYNGTLWSDAGQTPSFILVHSPEGSSSGNPYNSVTSARILGNLWASQVFTLNAARQLQNVSVLVRKNAAAVPNDHLNFQLRWANNTPITTFAVLVDKASASGSYVWRTAAIPGSPVLPRGSYLLVLQSADSSSASAYRWLALSTIDFFSIPSSSLTFNGSTESLLQHSADGGSSWTQRKNMDFAFFFNATLPPDSTAPSVSLVSPANGTNFTSGSGLEFACLATDNFGLSSINFYSNFTGAWAVNDINSTPVNNSLAKFAHTLADGVYAWNCKATDESGNSAFAPFNHTLAIDSTPPVSSIISLPNNAVVNGIVTLNANAQDNLAGVANVTFEYFNATQGWMPINSSSSPPFSAVWDTSVHVEGLILVRSVATDRFGNRETSSTNFKFFIIDRTPPSVFSLEVIYPTGQDFVTPNQMVTLQLKVSDNFGVANVTLNASALGGEQEINMTVTSVSFADPFFVVPVIVMQANVTVADTVDEGIHSLGVVAWDHALPAANHDTSNATAAFDVEVQLPSKKGAK